MTAPTITADGRAMTATPSATVATATGWTTERAMGVIVIASLLVLAGVRVGFKGLIDG